jgi:hypothetical protein
MARAVNTLLPGVAGFCAPVFDADGHLVLGMVALGSLATFDPDLGRHGRPAPGGGGPATFPRPGIQTGMKRLNRRASRHPRGHGAAPPWRALAILAVAVLGIHALVLRSSPARFGPELNPASQRVQPLATRSITPPPVQPAATPESEPSQAPPQNLQAKTASSPGPPEPVAINSVATSPIKEPAPSESPAPEAVAAVAPASAASAPAAPAGPVQTPVTAMALPESVKLEYKMTGSAKGLSYHADAELNWRRAAVFTMRACVSARCSWARAAWGAPGL